MEFAKDSKLLKVVKIKTEKKIAKFPGVQLNNKTANDMQCR